MVTSLSAAKKHAAQREPFQQSTPVRRSSFQLRALRKYSQMIKTQMLHCPTTYTTTSEMSLSDLGEVPAKHRQNHEQDQGGHHATYPFRSSRNTDKIRGDILVLGWHGLQCANRGRLCHLRSGWNEEHLFYTTHIPYRLAKDKPLFREILPFLIQCAHTGA